MASVAAHSTTVKLAGTSTAFTNETMDDSGDQLTYDIAAATKSFWDGGTAPTVDVDPDGISGYSTVAASTYTVDYLRGRVTFGIANDPAALVRVSGDYYPLWTFGDAHSYETALSVDLADDTTFADGGERTKLPTLGDLKGSLDFYDNLLTDYDTGAGTLTLLARVFSGTLQGFEINPGGVSGFTIRGHAYFESTSEQGAVDGLVTHHVGFACSKNGAAASFSGYQQ